MAAIIFTTSLEKPISSGVDRGVVYTKNSYAQWFGLVEVKTQYSDTDQKTVYVDGMMNRVQTTLTGFDASCVCYYFPEEIEDVVFGFTYRTHTDATHYETHLVYGCRAKLDDLRGSTLSSTINATYFTIALTTKPEYIPIKGYVPGSHLVIRSDTIWSEALKAIEDALYGTSTTDPRMPSIDEVIEILEQYVSLRVTAHGDGTWTAEEINTTGIIKMEDTTEFSITWDSAKYIDDQVYTIESL